AEIADKALAMLEIDENGLDEMDKRILEAVIVKFGGGPVGLSSLAVAVGEEPDTLEEVYEPYLIMEGYLKRTPQGRVATELSYKKLGLKPLRSNQQTFLEVRDTAWQAALRYPAIGWEDRARPPLPRSPGEPL